MRHPNDHRQGRFPQRPNRFRRPNDRWRGSSPTPGKTPAEESFLSKTVIDPRSRLRLEDGSSDLTMRAMDLICPIGRGQRGLIVSPPKAGKTTFLKQICISLAKA